MVQYYKIIRFYEIKMKLTSQIFNYKNKNIKFRAAESLSLSVPIILHQKIITREICVDQDSKV